MDLGYDDETVENSAVCEVLRVFRAFGDGVNGGDGLAHLLQGLRDDEIFSGKKIPLLRFKPAHLEIRIIIYGVSSTFRHIRS